MALHSPQAACVDVRGKSTTKVPRNRGFKITDFLPSNKVKKALSDRKEVLCCSEAQKKTLKKISSILIIPH